MRGRSRRASFSHGATRAGSTSVSSRLVLPTQSLVRSAAQSRGAEVYRMETDGETEGPGLIANGTLIAVRKSGTAGWRELLILRTTSVESSKYIAADGLNKLVAVAFDDEEYFCVGDHHCRRPLEAPVDDDPNCEIESCFRRPPPKGVVAKLVERASHAEFDVLAACPEVDVGGHTWWRRCRCECLDGCTSCL